MFNKKQLFSVCLTVLISVSLVALVAQATSTIGDDITVGDDLTVTGDVAVTGNTALTGTFASTGTSTLTGALLVDTNVLYADSYENKVGVNTTSTSNIFAVSTSSADTAAGPYFVITTAGKVGIASSSPATALAVTGTSTLRTLLPDADDTYSFGVSNKRWKTLDLSATSTIGGALLVDTSVLYADSYENKVGVNSTSTSNIFTVATSSTALPSLVITTSGLVGVASSSPATALAVTGTSTLRTLLPDADATYYIGNTGKTWLAVLSTTTMTTASIGSGGTAITRHLSTSTSIDLPSVTATTCATSAVSVGLSGVVAGNVVMASPTASGSLIEAESLTWSAYASSTSGYVCLTVCNVSKNDINIGAQTWTFDVWSHGY